MSKINKTLENWKKSFFWQRRRKRIQMDNSLLVLLFVFTAVLFFFKSLYPENQRVDDVLDFFGVIMIIKGCFFRMAARGHKKKAGRWDLVTTGPYSIVRNPMYLGSFTIGMGFVLLLWPWWTLPIFAFVFYKRFMKQITAEEAELGDRLEKDFKSYCRRVPRLWPSFKKARKLKTRVMLNFDEMISTRETNNLYAWLGGAILLESIQEMLIYGTTDVYVTFFIVTLATSLFFFSYIAHYQYK